LVAVLGGVWARVVEVGNVRLGCFLPASQEMRIITAIIKTKTQAIYYLFEFSE